MSHPFTEYHEDSEIGAVLWRLEYRRQARRDSQDGEVIAVLSRSIERDLARLKALKEEYKPKETP